MLPITFFALFFKKENHLVLSCAFQIRTSSAFSQSPYLRFPVASHPSSSPPTASKYLDKWGVKEGGDLGDVIAKVHELEIKWCEQQTAMLGDVKASKKAFVSILKQEQAADYAERSSQQAMKQVSKAEKMLASLKKKGANTATAETKLRQAQSIYEMCDNEKSSM